MADGTTESIEHLRPGNWILSRDDMTGETRAKRILHVSVAETEDSLSLQFSNGEKIETTSKHPFFVFGKGLVEADNLNIQTACELQSKEGVIPVSIQRNHRGRHKVYNLEAEDFHTYFVGKSGIWVHDLIPCK